jgi:hypothetical protein|tara:strand:- start:1142 stop:2299 length:1158 start_codon:yes stop_codon:yes gene_type:complete
MSKCEIAPISGFQSTNLNSRVDNFNRLGDRILRSLGYPFTNVEIHRDQLYENISIAVEYFSKFAGYTKEYLIFDSNLYKKDYGIKIDDLFTLQNSSTFDEQKELKTPNKDFTKSINTKETVFAATSAIPGSLFSSISSLSSALENGISANDIFAEDFYSEIISELSAVKDLFIPQVKNNITRQGSIVSETEQLINSFDYDVMDYRKVIAVTDFEEGSSTGINTLFTIEQSLAQQTYFSYAMGNYGFDLVSWYTLKNWLETREKMLATKRSYAFDERTQLLRMFPQPNASSSNIRFYGVVSCYVERPIRDILKELWVYQYSLALTKMAVANIRGKYGNVTLFGGGSLNSSEFMSQGLSEKAALEEQLMTGAAPGQGDADPPLFFVG